MPLAGLLRAHLRKRSVGGRGEGLHSKPRVQILPSQVKFMSYEVDTVEAYRSRDIPSVIIAFVDLSMLAVSTSTWRYNVKRFELMSMMKM
ncbi:hypothetical protein QJS10_CPA10g01306 [Acorus calamus]|uniref:Uncharacterized protein n=1 Tax=Acorus calamus TaxID=4465 RepID=A0AAV9DY71_ACOCL|nr:hypothetical protein QJS10_CPA10g01306 [Acorus calamus]